jgi:ribosomal protein S18 acetylase RimI-like enzyme
MDDIRIVPTAGQYVAGFHAVVDAVARERRYIGFIEAPPLERTNDFVQSLLAGAGVQLLAVDGEDTVVGWCDIIRNYHEGFRHGGRLGMGLLSQYRGRGVGRRLAVDTIRAAHASGIERIELEVFASNGPAIALYQKLGFVTEGTKRQARKLDGEYDDNILMALIGKGSLMADRSRPARVPSEGINIRRASETDSEAIVAIVQTIAAERLHSAIDRPWTVEQERAFLCSLTPREAIHVAVAAGGQVVGFQSLDLAARGTSRYR